VRATAWLIRKPISRALAVCCTWRSVCDLILRRHINPVGALAAFCTLACYNRPVLLHPQVFISVALPAYGPSLLIPTTGQRKAMGRRLGTPHKSWPP
jgi:hypothetical protein